MPITRSQAQLYEDLADRYGRAVADAFFAAIDDIRSAAEIARLTAAIEAGQIEEALDALHIDPEVFDAMLDRIREAHTEGGRTAVETMPSRRPDGTALVVRFDGRNREAEERLSRYSSGLITRITQDQREAVRASLRASMERGVNPRQAALDIVGRVNRATGRREGGILGLTMTQEGYVRGAREQLESGDPAQMRAYLTRGRRDKRFDRSVEKAIREERPVAPEITAKALIAYERRLLQLRGEMIGRTEAMAALHAAQWEAYRQAVDSGKVAESAIKRIWRSASDGRVRHSHMILDGETAGLREAFVSPTGARMLYPGDTSQGAGPEDVINCRCVVETRINFFANLR